MHLYPSEEWLDEYTRLLDESDALDDLSSGVGFDFAGSIHLAIEELPLAETTVGDLPGSVLEGVPDRVVRGLADLPLAELPGTVDEPAREGLPEEVRDLLAQIETNVVDGALHVLLEIDGGDCADAEVFEHPGRRDPDFTVRGSYGTWREVVDGRPSTSALLTGDFRVEGNQLRGLQYVTMFQLLGDVASEVETTHLFETEPQSAGSVLVDEAVRHPASIHRFAHRQAVQAFGFL